MKPQARIQSVIDVLQILQDRNLPMDLLIGDYMRGRRYIGAKDRRYIAETLYDVVRHTGRIGWVLEQAGAEDTPRNRALAFLVLHQDTDDKRLSDLFDGSKYAPEKLTSEETKCIKLMRGVDMNAMPLAVQVECPPEYESELRTLFGEDFAAEMQAMLEPATLDLRVNVFLKSREEVQQSLEKDDIESVPTPYSPWGLRCTDKAYLAKSKAFHKGWVAIQDEGSQMIAAMCDPQPGQQVMDYCAGGGGKTLALASAMQRKGRIVAMDTDEKRLQKGRDRYKKAQLTDIIEVRPLDEKNRKWLRRQKGKFDIVLCDAPCSGTGTWRRNPDMRWHMYGPSLQELLQVQRDILERACTAVKTGGRLVYATCSLLREENEAQIERFLEEHKDFELKPIDNTDLGQPYMRLTPHRHNTDGFFTAVLIRR